MQSILGDAPKIPIKLWIFKNTQWRFKTGDEP